MAISCGQVSYCEKLYRNNVVDLILNVDNFSILSCYAM